MGNLSERLRELKSINRAEVSEAAREIRDIIKSMPQLNQDDIKTFLNTSLLSLFNSQNNIDEKRIGRVVEELSKQTKEQGESSGKNHKMMEKHHEIISGLQESIDSINERLDMLSTSVSGLNTDVDLTGVEKSIKQIKPTDLTSLMNKMDEISFAVDYISKQKKEKIDLSKVIKAAKPKNVEFKLVTNQHGFPTGVIAKEI